MSCFFLRNVANPKVSLSVWSSKTIGSIKDFSAKVPFVATPIKGRLVVFSQ